jgi:hypothetical protein
MTESRDPELLVLSKILSTENLGAAKLLGLSSEMFLRWKGIFNWIESFEKKYKKCPSVITVQENFPEFIFLNTVETIEFYISELHNAISKKKYIDFVGELNVSLKAKDFGKAADLTSSLYRDVVYRPGESSDLRLSSVFSESLNTVNNFEVEFTKAIPTGYRVSDEEIGGWYPGDFNAFFGMPYTGKTWNLLWNAVCVAKAGGHALVGSGEMAPDKVHLRLLSLWFGVPAKRARQGKLTKKEKDTIKRLSQETPAGEITIIECHTMRGIDLLRRKAFQYMPDAIFVDSWYSLLEKRRGMQRWEAITELASDFKRLALELNIPITVTHQLNRSAASSKRGGNLSDIAGAFDLAGWLDNAVFFVLNDELRKTREQGIIFRKARDFDPFSFTVDFNVNEGWPIKVKMESWVLEEMSNKIMGGISDDDLNDLVQSNYI